MAQLVRAQVSYIPYDRLRMGNPEVVSSILTPSTDFTFCACRSSHARQGMRRGKHHIAWYEELHNDDTKRQIQIELLHSAEHHREVRRASRARRLMLRALRPTKTAPDLSPIEP